MKSLAFESKEDLRRIKLIIDITQESSMSKRLMMVMEYEKELERNFPDNN